MRRIVLKLLLLLGIFASLTAYPADKTQVWAVEDIGVEVKSGEFTYITKADKTAEIVGYTGKEAVVVVPGELDGKTVTSITGAFAGCENISSVTIPDSVTCIGKSAFSGCSELRSIVLPESVTSIEEYGFFGCSSLNSITIPGSVTRIGSRAFLRCGGLSEITLPDSVKRIGEGAFSRCESLRRIVLPEGLKTIQTNLFSNCGSLDNVTIPKSVISIGAGAFSGCSSLSSITLPAKVRKLEENTFGSCSNLSSITMLAPVNWIQEDAFYKCGNLREVYYAGNQTKWKGMWVLSGNTDLMNAKIYYNSTMAVKLSKAKFVFNGKEQQPKVTVTDKKGKKLSASKYKITYKDNKNVGLASATVSKTGKDKESQTVYFFIVPKGTDITGLSSKGKNVSINWKKQTKQTSGYEISYCTSKGFEWADKVSVKNNKTIRLQKKLKEKETYYVKIRTYKSVKYNGKSQKVYSEWSTPESVQIK